MSPTPLHYFGPENDRDQVVVPMARAPRPDGPRQTGVSTINQRTLGRRWIAASISAHLLIVVALLLGLFQPDQATPPPVLKITLVQRGPGGEGASGGGKEQAPQSAAQTSAPEAETPPAAEPPPAEIAPPPEPVEPPPPPKTEIPPPKAEIPPPPPPEIPKPTPIPTPPVVAPPPPQVAIDVPPPKPRHVPPRRQARQTPPFKPAPTPAPAPTPPAQTAVATPGISSGPDANAGPGKGAEGAGKGAIGNTVGPGDDYLERLYRHLLRYKKYPPEAISAKLQGSVVVGFTIARDGSVSGARIEKSSGSPVLDEATLALVQKASPAPPLPDSYKGNEARVKFPIDYKLSLIDQMF